MILIMMVVQILLPPMGQTKLLSTEVMGMVPSRQLEYMPADSQTEQEIPTLPMLTMMDLRMLSSMEVARQECRGFRHCCPMVMDLSRRL